MKKFLKIHRFFFFSQIWWKYWLKTLLFQLFVKEHVILNFSHFSSEGRVMNENFCDVAFHFSPRLIVLFTYFDLIWCFLIYYRY